MSGRPSGGVQGLRAMFEQNGIDTSPPSRGRSPADSVTSESSRPISKVRTSFISVERGGQQGPGFGLKRMSTGEGSVGGDGMNEGNSGLGGSVSGAAKTNGHAIPSAPEGKTQMNGHEKVPADGDQNENPKNPETSPVKMEVPPANPDKPIAAAEEEPASLLPADPKDENAVTGGTALKDNEQDLGSVLKGSPFEESFGQRLDALKSTDVSAADKPLPKADEARSNVSDKANGQAKAPNSASKPPPTSSDAHLSPTHPPIVDTKKDVGTSPRASTITSGNRASKSPRVPQTEATNSIGKKPASKPSSPRAAIPPKNGTSSRTQDTKTTYPSTGRSSLAPQNSVQGPKPRQVSSTSSQASTRNVSHPTPGVKPRAKSPTRPVRLPSSATAPTAASAAKAPSSRSPSRASQVSVSKPLRPSRPSVVSNSGASARPKPARSSLPAQSNASQKPKPRTSTAGTAGTKPAGGDFLARMMRPTESSASKVHEKVEVKSPPRKTQAPKRKSGGSKGSADHAKTHFSSGEVTHPSQPDEEVVGNYVAEASKENGDKPETGSPMTPGKETAHDPDGNSAAGQPVEQPAQ
ncbi:MAG: hypothetical protein Q9191_003514 [Dirinaria sp. TL-2023a]